MPESFAPSVVIDGRAVQPPGWMWQLSFALAGCQWAIDTCSTEEWKETVKAWYREQKRLDCEEQIAYLEKKLGELRRVVAEL